MFIDIHTHVTNFKLPEFSSLIGREPFDYKVLLERMDREGIDKSVLLPINNPENLDFFAVAGNAECLDLARTYPDRFYTFTNIDPRGMLNKVDVDFGILLRAYKQMGSLGIGEVCANLSITNKFCKNLFYHAGKEKMPLLFHLSPRFGGLYGLVDKLGLPGLEEVLKEFPDTIFIGHAPTFWNEIDGNLKKSERNSYPQGEISKKGRLWELMEKYPNLYADISAGSGHNALSRDSEKGYEFFKKFNKKIFFGTDRFTSIDEPIPGQIAFLKDGLKNKNITKAVYENITHRNFEKVFLNN